MHVGGRMGGCQCGSVRYEAAGEPIYSAVCHCADCRASSGAPAVAWMAFREDQLEVKSGKVTTYKGRNGVSARQFCPICGTGLFFRNEHSLPGLVDIQLATLDHAQEEVPSLQVQCAEKLGWVDSLNEIPQFERYPAEPV